MSRLGKKAGELSAKLGELEAATKKAFANLKAYRAPILPTVELPDRISAWSYEISRNAPAVRIIGDEVENRKETTYWFRFNVDQQACNWGLTEDDVADMIDRDVWQDFWDNIFAKSIARADEVKS